MLWCLTPSGFSVSLSGFVRFCHKLLSDLHKTLCIPRSLEVISMLSAKAWNSDWPCSVIVSLLRLLLGLKIKKSLTKLSVLGFSQHCAQNTDRYETKLYATTDEIEVRIAWSTCFVCLFQWCVTHPAGRWGSTWWAFSCCWLWLGSTSGSCGNLEPSPRHPPSPTLTIDICKKNMEPPFQKSDKRYIFISCYSKMLNISAVHKIYLSIRQGGERFCEVKVQNQLSSFA